MFECPACNKANNIHRTSCQHCGGPLVPAGAPGASDAVAEPALEPCSKCGHAEIVVVSPFAQADPNNRGSLIQPPVVAYVADAQVRSAGSFRAHVCASCGFTEWYANDLDALTRAAGKAWNTKRVQATVPDPYR